MKIEDFEEQVMKLFYDAVHCQGHGYIPGTEIRARVIVGDMMRLAMLGEDQPMIGRLGYLANRIERGFPLPKKCVGKIGQEMWMQIGAMYLDKCLQFFRDPKNNETE